jgi:hypothetical protein
MEKMMQQIIEMLAKAEADRKAYQEKMDSYQEKMAADRKANKEESREANQELLTKMKEDRKADQEKMAADKEDFLARMDAIHEKRMAMLDDHQRRMMATKKIEQNPKMMQSVEEHRDVPGEDVAVMPVKGLKKQRRGRKSTAGRRGEPKELNRGNCTSRRKLAAACRKVSRHAAVVWRKRKLYS